MLLSFTDGTQISIDLETSTRVKTRHYRSAPTGDLDVLHEHQEPGDADLPGKVSSRLSGLRF